MKSREGAKFWLRPSRLRLPAAISAAPIAPLRRATAQRKQGYCRFGTIFPSAGYAEENFSQIGDFKIWFTQPRSRCGRARRQLCRSRRWACADDLRGSRGTRECGAVHGMRLQGRCTVIQTYRTPHMRNSLAERGVHCSFAYSALACFRMGMSGSAQKRGLVLLRQNPVLALLRCR